MKKKLIGIFVCMLVTTTTLSVTGIRDDKIFSSIKNTDLIPILDFQDIRGRLLGFSVVLKNYGEGTAESIFWEMNSSGGLFLYPKIKNGVIDVLPPGEAEIIKISPALGLGVPTLTFYCKYRIMNLSYDIDFEVKQEWRMQALLIWHTFPEEKQPIKEWMVVENYTYFNNKSEAPGVEFHYAGILNMHNVRVVLDQPLFARGIEFLAACKFTDGEAVLYECWLTKDLVMNEDAHWEVELVDGG